MAAEGKAGQAEVSQTGLTRLPPVGFWSYARQDDELSFGKLSTLRSLLIHELQQQYGREQIRLFQDASTIPHGSDWELEIKKAIDASMFFIPIITPNFIQSEWCAREVELFLEREQALIAQYPALRDRGRIFPILFIDIEDVEPENETVLAALQKLQWFDFRRFRHRSFEEAEVREALSDLAGTIRSLLKMKLSGPSGTTKGSEPPAPVTDTSSTGSRGKGTARQPVRQIETGDLLNHMFEVKRFIKAGGMGQVFEGSNIMTGERVAIKALLPAMANDPKVAELFQREALTLTRLNHEALVQYRALAKEPELGVLYIVTEYVDGVDLADALGEVERGPAELKRLLGRLAAGLAAAHRLGAIHRDMSPDNVMLPGGDLRQAKIIDFGIAKDLGGNLPTLIGPGFAGKLNYVAPEQLGEHEGDIGPWTDVYSLALVILAVAAGQKVDMSGSISDAIRKRRAVPDVSVAPEELRPLLADMLHPDPGQRLRSMEEVIARLDAPAPPRAEGAAPPPEPPPADEAGRTVVAPPSTPPPAAPTQPVQLAAIDSPKPKWPLLLILGGLLAAVAVALFLLLRGGEPPAPPEPQIVTLPSGVRYQVVRDGTGPTITRSDVYRIRYRLHTNSLDGPIVGQAGFGDTPLTRRVSAAHPSLAEVLTRMREGGRYLVWLPPGTFDSVPSNGNFSPDDTLVFDLEIIRVERDPSGGGAMLAPAPRMAAPAADGAWLIGRWCVRDAATGRQSVWQISRQGNQLRVSYPGDLQVETIRSASPTTVTTDAATYLREGNAVTVREENANTRLEQCR